MIQEFKETCTVVVHCITKKDAVKCCELADKLGLKWNGGESYIDCNWWERYRKETCYNFVDCQFESLWFYKHIGGHKYEIRTAKWFLKNEKITIDKYIRL